METLTQNEERIEIGSVVAFDETQSLLAINQGKKLIQGIIELRDEYLSLEISPFNNEKFSELFNNGIGNTELTLTNQVEKKEKIHVLRKRAIANVHSALEYIEDRIQELKKSFTDTSNRCSYSF